MCNKASITQLSPCISHWKFASHAYLSIKQIDICCSNFFGSFLCSGDALDRWLAIRILQEHGRMKVEVSWKCHIQLGPTVIMDIVPFWINIYQHGEFYKFYIADTAGHAARLNHLDLGTTLLKRPKSQNFYITPSRSEACCVTLYLHQDVVFLWILPSITRTSINACTLRGGFPTQH